MDSPIEADVAVVGGGPAGATCAALLAGFGRTVVLLHREAARESMPEEALVAGAREVLARAGVAGVLDPLLHPGPERQGVIWGDGRLRWRETGADGRGFQVVRSAFDAALRNAAAASGVAVIGIRSLREPIGGSGGGGIRVVTTEGGTIEVRSPVVAVATGRLTSPAILPVETTETLPETVALVATGAAPTAWARASVIEAVPEGWWWWLPLRSGGASLTLLADAGDVNARGRAGVWDCARAHASGPARGFEAAPATGAVATARLLVTPAEALLLGDAACTVDPLSSQGLEKAIVSAREAALAANTILDEPGEAAAIRSHLDARARGLFEAHARRALGLLAEERRFAEAPFWRRRHEAAERRAVPAPGPPAPDRRLVPHPDLHRARCFHAAGGKLAAGDGFRIHPGAEALDAVGAVPLDALLAAVAGGGTPREILERAARVPALFPLTPRIVAEALTRLVALGFVVAEAPA